MVKHILKKLLPRYLIDRLQVFREHIDIRIASWASRSQWLSVLYYSIYSAEFRREMHTVLLARRRYYGARRGENPSSYLLRRNIHRLEKGLIMQPRRALFGEGYIVETLDYFGLCMRDGCLTATELSWARSVIEDYFSVVGQSEITDQARVIFDQLEVKSPDVINSSKSSPLSYASLPAVGVSFDDFAKLCARRHSVRWFEAKPVSSELINAAIDVAATAPSACNRQPFKFYVFDDPATAQRIGAIPMGTAGFSYNFQSVIVVVGDLSAYPFEKDRHIIYIDGGLAVMQLQLALETQGLGSCAINWPDIDRHERLMAKELGLKPYQRPVMLLAVGYPQKDALVPYSAKRTASDLIERPK